MLKGHKAGILQIHMTITNKVIMIDDNITISVKHDHGKTENGGIRSVGVLLRTVPMSDWDRSCPAQPATWRQQIIWKRGVILLNTCADVRLCLASLEGENRKLSVFRQFQFGF